MLSHAEMKKREAREKKERLQYELPHLYGYKWYRWAKSFFDTREKTALLCAANQISKSSTQIRKVIHWATDTRLWPELWPEAPTPREFWYLYPTYDLATTEFQNKWVPEFLPKRGQFIKERFKEECIHPIYGWKAVYEKKKISAIEFANGLILYFKAYSQNVHNLQAGTVHYIACDEELPEDLYDELNFRRQATDGYFSMVFTATRNQLMWYLAMECMGMELEKFPEAFKLQVSMYECQEYMDGSPGKYSEEKIQKAINKCKNDTEVERRVKGRFVTEVGRKYGAFDPKKHFIKPHAIPKNWAIYGGVDPGSGGQGGHPAGLGFIAVRPDFRYGVVFAGWRGDGIETTSGDILDKYVEIRGEHTCTQQTYDKAAKDFYMVASRCGESFIKCDKSHDTGEDIINTLFKKNALQIFDTPELRKLGTELITLKKDTPKKQAKDDFIDGAVRYPCAIIPWDFTFLRNEPTEEQKAEELLARKKRPLTEEEFNALQLKLRRGETPDDKKDDYAIQSAREFEDELEFWNGMYE